MRWLGFVAESLVPCGWWGWSLNLLGQALLDRPCTRPGVAGRTGVGSTCCVTGHQAACHKARHPKRFCPGIEGWAGVCPSVGEIATPGLGCFAETVMVIDLAGVLPDPDKVTSWLVGP